jgi:predicted nucleotidyltransferase
MADLIQPAVLDMLREIEPILQKFDIDFYVVGAIARDIQLGDFINTRKTNDVDIAIRVGDEKQFSALKKALIDTGRFTAHESEAIKLFHNGAIELDLLPFGDIEDDKREIKLYDPKLFTISMPGFKEAYPFAEEIDINKAGSFKICSLEGLVLLKLVAYGDKPSRTKDVTDIDHILRYFFEINQDNVYDDHFDIMEIYNTEDRDYLPLVGARVIGRKLNLIVGDDKALRDRISNTLIKRPTNLWQALLDGLTD